ncbi:MAG: hypothetical protein IPP89_14300 [Saprospiraceae bacterium]|nr:hypothetical protein [Candidatus Brachybacter algidus]MBL0120108.1 hypothetical protein [Candidatus Brachybacter algidus]
MYYFTLGNIFYNMTHHGNSWMMMRYGWSTNEEPDNKIIVREWMRLIIMVSKSNILLQKAADASKNKNSVPFVCAWF